MISAWATGGAGSPPKWFESRNHTPSLFLVMNSITTLLRRKGYPIREIGVLLRDLKPTAGHNALTTGMGRRLDEVLTLLKREPLTKCLAQSRVSLEEEGIQPSIEYGHTLKVPIPGEHGQPDANLCFTRVSQEQWVYLVDRH